MDDEDSLTQEEIDELVLNSFNNFTDSYLDDILSDMESSEDRKYEPYFERLKDYDVLEIGPWTNPVNDHFECGSYEAATRSLRKDGLTVLRDKPENSHVVLSFGVMDDNILSPHQWSKSENSKKYIRELAEQIKRVSNPYAIIYGLHARKYLGEPDIPIPECNPKKGGVFLYEENDS